MSYKLGDTWSRTFDYDGMLTKGMEASVDWPIEDLQMLYTSFEDVNYHSRDSLNQKQSLILIGTMIVILMHLFKSSI